MDDKNKAKLEEIRLRVPRYLFRGWSPFSGGDANLNTTQAITPRYFLCNPATHIYTWDARSFKQKISSHLGGGRGDTIFSSWGACLSTVMGYCADQRSGHISIIDTSRLFDQVPIFHVMDLRFLGKLPPYAEEYLAYGVVSGEYHRALPYRAFLDANAAGFSVIRWDWTQPALGLTEECVRLCRRVAEQYGQRFAMPMTLAMIARTLIYDLGIYDISLHPEFLKIIEEAVDGLPIRGNWHTDIAITEDRVYTTGFPEVKHFIALLRHFSRTLIDESGTEGRVTEVDEDPAIDQARQTDMQFPISNLDDNLRKTKGKTKIEKSTAAPKQKTPSDYKKKVEKLQRQLDIDMNRYGRKRYDGKNEREARDSDVEGGTAKEAQNDGEGEQEEEQSDEEMEDAF